MGTRTRGDDTKSLQKPSLGFHNMTNPTDHNPTPVNYQWNEPN